MAAVLEFEHVSKRYRPLFRDDRWALRDFSLRVEPGEIVGFLGPNGAGKTTAINIAVGLVHATGGSGFLLGRKFGEVSARRRVGFLPESPAYYHRSARATLKLCGALDGVREPELSRRTSELLAAVRLEGEAELSVGKFSRGMLQRVGVAQAFINDPDLLILDEPTSALDPISRLHVRQLLLDARNRGKSVFLSSHQLSEIELICDRIFFVQAGRVVAAGATGELLQSSEACEITVSNTNGLPASASDIHRQSNQTTFTIPFSEQRAAIEQIWAAGGTLIRVTRKAKSLEEVFVDIMNPEGKAGERTT